MGAEAVTTVMTVNRTLLQRADQLVREHQTLPAGSVLRCFARAVGDLRRRGCDLNSLPDAAELRTRSLLATRVGNDG